MRTSIHLQVLLNLAASHTSSHAVRNAGIAMVLQSLIHSVTQVCPALRLPPSTPAPISLKSRTAPSFFYDISNFENLT